MKRNKPKAEKEGLTITMRLQAEMLRQSNKSQNDLQTADLLDAAAKRIDDLEVRLRNKSVS